MFFCPGRFRRFGVLLLVLANCSTALSAAELALRDNKLAQTPEGRKQLKYLVNCALPADVTVITSAGGRRYTFPGGMGLAPEWSARPLTPAEQQRVSACMLARTNFFGKPVKISMRSDAADAPQSLQADSAERRDYPFFEAGFFGNLFQEQPVAYVCTGDNPPPRAQHLRSLMRVCSLPDSSEVQSVSRCRFLITGSCQDHPFTQNGVDYSNDVLNVYLPGPKIKK